MNRRNTCLRLVVVVLFAVLLTAKGLHQTSLLPTRTARYIYNDESSISVNRRQWSRNSHRRRRTAVLSSSTVGDNEMEETTTNDMLIDPNNNNNNDNEDKILNTVQQSSSDSNDSTIVKKLIDGLPFVEIFKSEGYKKLPPIQVEDMNLLLYDVFLLVNLTLSISFWVTHRMDFQYLPAAFNEGSLLGIFWIVSGLYNGAFLGSAVDGHYRTTDEESGPKAAAILALNTFVNAINLRLIFALIVAVLQHRQVGITPGEQLLPLEIGFGLVLMTCWRALHSSITPRY